MSRTPRTTPLAFVRLDPAEMRARAKALLADAQTRRSVRHFSTEPVDLDVVRACIHAASQAPSGANKQPWTFVLVTDPRTKRRIREAAEREERAFYAGRAPNAWLEDLEPLGTNPEKAFITDAPALIVVFAHRFGQRGEKHYYVNESVGIAVGMLIAAIHHVGLATVTHTPSPMGFLSEELGRPANERAYVMLPVGYPVDGCRVPEIERKPIECVLVEEAARAHEEDE